MRRLAALMLLGLMAGGPCRAQFVPELAQDASFGPYQGSASFPLADLLGTTLVHPNGHYYGASGCRVAGQRYPGLYRWTADGHPDSTFGGAALGCSTVGPIPDAYLHRLALLSDGKVLVAGTSAGKSLFARFTENGVLDAAYGTNGLTQSTRGAGKINGLCVLPGDRAVAFVGTTLVWLSAQGQVDSTGVAPWSTALKGVLHAACRPDGTFMLLGQRNTGAGERVVVRLDAHARLDASYGTGGGHSDVLPIGEGLTTTQSTDFLFRFGFRVDALGRAYVTGAAAGQLAVSRLTPTGALDATFGTGGTFTLHLTGASTTPLASAGRSLLPLAGGGLLVGGTANLPDGYGGLSIKGIHPLVVHLTDAGQLASTLGGIGVARLGSVRNSHVGDLHGTADGRLVALYGMNNGGTTGVYRFSTTVAVGRDDAVPAHSAGLSLAVSPNPSRGPVAVALDVPRQGAARVSVHDVLGREVALLHDGPMAPGPQRFVWEGPAPAGMYLVRLVLRDGTSATRRVFRMP